MGRVEGLEEGAGGAGGDSGEDFWVWSCWEWVEEDFGELEVVWHGFWVGERAWTGVGEVMFCGEGTDQRA